jgi:hypothetical protein
LTSYGLSEQQKSHTWITNPMFVLFCLFVRLMVGCLVGWMDGWMID